MSIKVPDEMLKAATKAVLFAQARSQAVIPPRELISLEAALTWLSVNPVVPTIEDVQKILASRPVQSEFPNFEYMAIYVASQWQRHIFLAPEDEIPEGLSAEGWLSATGYCDSRVHPSPYIAKLLEGFEAYRQRSSK